MMMIDKQTEFETQKKRLETIITLLFDCRSTHKISQCSKCAQWSKDGILFVECPYTEEQNEFGDLTHSLKVRLPLEKLELPRSIRDQIIKPKAIEVLNKHIK